MERPKRLNRKEVKARLEEITSLFQLSTKPTKVRSGKPAKEHMDTVRDGIDYIRVAVKYLFLDIESLKREIKFYKKLLKDNGINFS